MIKSRSGEWENTREAASRRSVRSLYSRRGARGKGKAGLLVLPIG